MGSDSQNAFKFAYLKKRDLDVDNVVTYFGRRFAAGWDELRTQPVAAIAQSVARNAVSVGCTLGSLSGDEARVEVLLTGWLVQKRSRTSSDWSPAIGTPCGTASTQS